MAEKILKISCLGVNVRLSCSTSDLYPVIDKNFEQMRTSVTRCQIDYQIARDARTGRISVLRPKGGFRGDAANTGEMIYVLEADLVVQLQLLRPELLFVHSAVVSKGGSATLLTGPSGAGKSTTCWGLINHNYRYLSDELAPIDMTTMSVSPYPHALCMKKMPPAGYPAPQDALFTDRGVHIMPSAMPTKMVEDSLQIGALLFVEHDGSARKPELSRIDSAEAAARLYPNVLNALAHCEDGLDAVCALTESVTSYRVMTADLADSCELIERELSG